MTNQFSNSKSNTVMFNDFAHSGKSLKKFIRSGNIFTIMLLDTTIIHYNAAPHADKFDEWLCKHNVENIKQKE
ncbi:hypothetical protein [Niabella beijingensis]|uniref:hypothetical protein n=1 Tax=Niabella beijingensis TaxID=2872700 RepID=UPI001CBF8471|nr:hypothetical protein [Niabella beijingensis]MBZ4189337.1 hypothetical protein [Niabella beijingensis]